MKTLLRLALGPVAVLAALVAVPSGASAQVGVEIVFSTQERAQIREFYASHHQAGARPLPPGIRKRLARGKPLPPGIAKQTLPSQLAAVLPTRDGYQHLQVGVDVLLVEVATGLIHDVLMDVIR
ncbi:MAG: hypothetical protein JSU98_09050 [Gemmatimonadales bacterium]|jgi:hypothetical protein|nr:MAG: hypothetical protein JSU98_09050 [Gemmatimonadales bacterium]